MKRKIWLPFSPLVLIVIIGVSLRFYHLGDFMQFGGDQGRDAFAARDIATLTDFKLTGPPSTTHGDLDSGPAYYYLLAIFSKIFNFAPEAGGIMVAFFGVLSVITFYFLTKEFFRENWSLLLTALYAVSNLIVFYQRFPWNPNLLLFFVLIYFWSLIQFFKEAQKIKYTFLMGTSFGLAIQMHFTALILIPVTAVALLVVEKRKLFSKNYLLPTSYFLFLVLLPHLPYLIYQYQHRFPAIKALVKIFLLFTGQAQAAEGIAKTPYLEQVSQNLAGLTGFVSQLLLATENQILGGLMLLAILAGLVWSVKRSDLVKGRTLTVLVVWLAISILAYAFYPKGLDEHYFLQMAPVILLAMGIFIGGSSRALLLKNQASTGTVPMRIGFIGIFGLIVLNLWQLGQDFRTLAKGECLPRYGVTLTENRKVVDFILQNRPPAPFSVQMFGQNRALSPGGYEYLLSLHGLKPNQDFLDSYRKVDYVFYIVEPKFVLEDPAWSAELDARIGHIHEKLAQTELGNVKVVYAKRPHEIFEQID